MFVLAVGIDKYTFILLSAFLLILGIVVIFLKSYCLSFSLLSYMIVIVLFINKKNKNFTANVQGSEGYAQQPGNKKFISTDMHTKA